MVDAAGRPTIQDSSMKNNRKRKRRRRNKGVRVGDLPLGFGRFVGRRICQVPRSYLKWAASGAARIPQADRWAINEFLRGSIRQKQRT